MDKLDINKILEQIRSKDLLTYEEAYYQLEEVANDYKEDILRELINESNSFIRGKFIELLGHCKDSSLIPIFKKELEREDEETISWALGALEETKSEEGLKIAKDFKRKNPKWD